MMAMSWRSGVPTATCERFWPQESVDSSPCRAGSEHPEPVVGGPQRAARLQRVPQPVLLRRLGQGQADGLVGESAGTTITPSSSATTRSPGRTGRPPTTAGCRHAVTADRPLQSSGSIPRHHRVAEGGYAARVAAVPVDQRAARTAGARRGGEQFAPAGGRAQPPAATRMTSPADVVERGDLAGIRLGGDWSTSVTRNGLARRDHLAGPRGRMAGRDMFAVPEVVEDVRHDRGCSRLATRSGRIRCPPRAHPAPPA